MKIIDSAFIKVFMLFALIPACVFAMEEEARPTKAISDVAGIICTQLNSIQKDQNLLTAVAINSKLNEWTITNAEGDPLSVGNLLDLFIAAIDVGVVVSEGVSYSADDALLTYAKSILEKILKSDLTVGAIFAPEVQEEQQRLFFTKAVNLFLVKDTTQTDNPSFFTLEKVKEMEQAIGDAKRKQSLLIATLIALVLSARKDIEPYSQDTRTLLRKPLTLILAIDPEDAELGMLISWCSQAIWKAFGKMDRPSLLLISNELALAATNPTLYPGYQGFLAKEEEDFELFKINDENKTFKAWLIEELKKQNSDVDLDSGLTAAEQDAQAKYVEAKKTELDIVKILDTARKASDKYGKDNNGDFTNLPVHMMQEVIFKLASLYEQLNTTNPLIRSQSIALKAPDLVYKIIKSDTIMMKLAGFLNPFSENVYDNFVGYVTFLMANNRLRASDVWDGIVLKGKFAGFRRQSLTLCHILLKGHYDNAKFLTWATLKLLFHGEVIDANLAALAHRCLTEINRGWIGTTNIDPMKYLCNNYPATGVIPSDFVELAQPDAFVNEKQTSEWYSGHNKIKKNLLNALDGAYMQAPSGEVGPSAAPAPEEHPEVLQLEQLAEPVQIDPALIKHHREQLEKAASKIANLPKNNDVNLFALKQGSKVETNIGIFAPDLTNFDQAVFVDDNPKYRTAAKHLLMAILTSTNTVDKFVKKTGKVFNCKLAQSLAVFARTLISRKIVERDELLGLAGKYIGAGSDYRKMLVYFLLLIGHTPGVNVDYVDNFVTTLTKESMYKSNFAVIVVLPAVMAIQDPILKQKVVSVCDTKITKGGEDEEVSNLNALKAKLAPAV